jgi:hypothetical protein
MRPSIRSRLIALVRGQWAGLLALFLVVAGGTAYAANTIGSSDIIDDQVFSADVRDDSLAGGGLARADLRAGAVGTSEVLNDTATGGGLSALDLRSGSVGPAEAAGLTGADIANAAGGSDNVNANKLDGLDSSGLVHGRGTLLSNRIVLVPGNPQKTLFVIPGLGVLTAHCFSNAAEITVTNTTSSTIDRWLEIDGKWYADLVPPGSNLIITTPTIPAMTLALGVGNDPGARRIATVHAFAFQSGEGAPCGFQAQATLWTSG